MDKKPKSITFYILWPGNTEEHCEREMNQIGVEYYHKKYTDKEKNLFHWEVQFLKKDGYKYLERAIVEDRMDVLEKSKIFNSNKKQFTIEQLFDRINKASKK
tara:strand:+ start:384 stop:689 length:306 start_codon:yes stop_codon:yes gene_type:complete